MLMLKDIVMLVTVRIAVMFQNDFDIKHLVLGLWLVLCELSAVLALIMLHSLTQKQTRQTCAV